MRQGVKFDDGMKMKN